MEPMPGYVYLLRLEQDKDPLKCVYKVGRTTNLQNRQKMLGILLPYKTTLVWAIGPTDMVWLETFFHQHFAEFRLEGEWFRLNRKALESFIYSGLKTEFGEQDLGSAAILGIVSMFAFGILDHELFMDIQSRMQYRTIDEFAEGIRRALQFG